MRQMDGELERRVVARFHDESHMNKYWANHPPARVLSCAYLYPEPTEEACWHEPSAACVRDHGHPWLWAPWTPSAHSAVLPSPPHARGLTGPLALRLTVLPPLCTSPCCPLGILNSVCTYRGRHPKAVPPSQPPAAVQPSGPPGPRLHIPQHPPSRGATLSAAQRRRALSAAYRGATLWPPCTPTVHTAVPPS